VNQSAFKLFGYSRMDFEIQGLTGFDFLVAEDHERARQNFARILAGEKMGLNEYVAVRRDGSVFPVLIDSAAIVRDGRTLGLRGFIIDIADRKRLEEKLQQAQRMEAVGTLAGGIAHDFNNLLMGIQGNTSLALLDTEAEHPTYEKLLNIASYVKNATELTRQLLGLGKGGKYEVLTCELSSLVNQVVDMFGRTRKELIIHKKFEADPLSVKVDQGQIDQVLLNIFVNAWQAMPGGGSITIETEKAHLDETDVNPFDLPAGDYARLTVTDTGEGIDEKNLARVFDPFFTTKEKERGTGLGLASAYGIIKNHGGIITVSSRRGEGTTFTIFLPITVQSPPVAASPPPSVSASSETILLVDDEAMIIEVGSRMLEKMGYVVLTAAGGKQAVDLLKKHGQGIDLVILDMIMPEMSGSETFNRIKALTPDVRVLLSSGYSVDGQAAEILQRGCEGFIQKPFDIETLSAKVREVLNGR
jgi:PAS domain S-box-containing protein